MLRQKKEKCLVVLEKVKELRQDNQNKKENYITKIRQKVFVYDSACEICLGIQQLLRLFLREICIYFLWWWSCMLIFLKITVKSKNIHSYTLLEQFFLSDIHVLEHCTYNSCVFSKSLSLFCFVFFIKRFSSL